MPDPFSIANSASADLIFLDLADPIGVQALAEQIRSLTELFSGPAAICAEQAAVVLCGPGDEEERRQATAKLLDQCLLAAETAAKPGSEAVVEVAPAVDAAQLEVIERADAVLANLDPRGDPVLYRRILHSLKGDAGVVGLRDEANCCHAMEDALARGLHPVHLASAVRWLGDSFSARRFGLPPPSFAVVLADLQRKPPLGETLVATGQVHPEAVAAALAQQASLTPGRPLGEILVDSGRISAQALAEVLQVPVVPPVRVDAARLAELDAALAKLTHVQRRLGLARQDQGRLDRAFRDVIRARRRLHITTARSLLERMARVAQETARALGIGLDLQLVGGEVEIERGLADRIADPLQHLVRNAVAHGLEPAAERKLLGKSSAGRLSIRVGLQGRGLRIEVEDDGRGIDRTRIAAKAGLSAGDLPDDATLWAIISRPGFSTASTISTISGRGIGLDVVADLVSQWNGSVALSSVVGHGTTFTITIPPAPT
jgi:chemotaxis protein histidine kinase CheA